MTIIQRRIFVKPRQDVVVINPETGAAISKDGELVLNNKYMRRRILDEDLIEVDMPSEGKSNSKKTQ